MDFSKTQFEALLSEIASMTEEFAGHLDRIGPVAAAAADRWYVPPAVAESIVWLADKTIEIGTDLLRLIRDILKGAVAPIYMFTDSWQWKDLRGAASGISSSLSEQHLVVDDSDWSGDARDSYLKAVQAQSAAAARIASVADSTSNHLIGCAVAGAAFYATLSVVLGKLIVAAVAAIAAFGSAVFSWAGAALILEEAGFSTSVIWTAVGTLTAFLSAQATAMISLHGEAVDVTAFPEGRWPASNSATYRDATVSDGDADWSLS